MNKNVNQFVGLSTEELQLILDNMEWNVFKGEGAGTHEETMIELRKKIKTHLTWSKRKDKTYE